MNDWVTNSIDILKSIADFFNSETGKLIFACIIFVFVCRVFHDIITNKK